MQIREIKAACCVRYQMVLVYQRDFIKIDRRRDERILFLFSGLVLDAISATVPATNNVSGVYWWWRENDGEAMEIE